MVKLLIDLGANVNHMDKRNGTALHVAITWGKSYASFQIEYSADFKLIWMP